MAFEEIKVQRAGKSVTLGELEIEPIQCVVVRVEICKWHHHRGGVERAGGHCDPFARPHMADRFRRPSTRHRTAIR